MAQLIQNCSFPFLPSRPGRNHHFLSDCFIQPWSSFCSALNVELPHKEVWVTGAPQCNRIPSITDHSGPTKKFRAENYRIITTAKSKSEFMTKSTYRVLERDYSSLKSRMLMFCTACKNFANWFNVLKLQSWRPKWFLCLIQQSMSIFNWYF